MNCKQASALLYRMADERLLDDDAAEVQRHVQSCGECARRFERIVALDEAIADAADEQPPARLRQTLVTDYRRRLAARSSQTRAWSGWVSLRRAASIGLVALVSSALTWLSVRDGASRGRDGERITQTPPAAARPAQAPLEGVFPLILSDSYTVEHADGRREHGARIQIVN